MNRFLSLQSHCLEVASEPKQISDLYNLGFATPILERVAIDLKVARHRLLIVPFEVVPVPNWGKDSVRKESALGTVTRRSQAISPEAVDPAYWVAIGIQRDSLILLASRVNNE